jgi:predicted transposase YbfD/YdcC
LDLLDITGSIITIDAMDSQRETAKKTVDNGADYILSVKGNQGSLEEEVKTASKQHKPVFDTGVLQKKVTAE